MRPVEITEELAEFRREVKAVLATALTEADAPLVVADLKRDKRDTGRPRTAPPRPPAPKASACWVCHTDEARDGGGGGRNDMTDVDRELGLLEQSNAALFTALAQTRVMPASRLPPAIDARMRSLGAREEARAGARLREVEEIQERERRRRLKKKQLEDRTRDLKRTVDDLERQKKELDKKLDDKRQRRRRREADARHKEEARRRDEKAKALQEKIGSTTREADRLRTKLRDRAEQATRARVREALWRWRAHAANAVAARERKGRVAVEKIMATANGIANGTANYDRGPRERDSHERDYGANRFNSSSRPQRYHEDPKRSRRPTDALSDSGAVMGYRGVYGGGGGDSPAIAASDRREHVGVEDFDAIATFGYSAGSSAPPVAAVAAAPPPPRHTASTSSPHVWVAEHGREQERMRVRRADSVEDPTAGAAVRTKRQGEDRVAAAAAIDSRWQGEEVQEPRQKLARERVELQRRGGRGGAEHSASTGKDAANERGRDEHSIRLWRASREERAKTLAQSLALILGAGVRASKRRRVQAAFRALKGAAVSTRTARQRRYAQEKARESREAEEAQEAREMAAAAAVAAGVAASVAAGAVVAAGVVGRARGRSLQRAFRVWAQASQDARRKDFEKRAALRRVAQISARRFRQVGAKVFHRWRLATAEAVMHDLRQQQRYNSLGRGALLVEAVFGRRDSARLRAGFQRWMDVCAKFRHAEADAAAARQRRADAATAAMAILHRRRHKQLRQGLYALRAGAEAAAGRRRREQSAAVSAARGQRAARTLQLTKCWGSWKAFAAAAGSARRLEAAKEQARELEAEERHLRMSQLAWACKCAMAAFDVRRKARAWRQWRQMQGLVDRERALVGRVLLAGADRRREGMLRGGLKRWKEGCERGRAEEELLQTRAARLRSVAVFLGAARSPRAEVSRAFRTWVQAAETVQVETLRRRQGARILLGMLRSQRRNSLVRAMEAWRSAGVRRVQDGRRLQSIALRTAHRQRVFFLGKAWSRIVWAAGEREAAKARKVAAARVLHGLLASAARASRRRALLRWRQAAAGAAASDRLRGAKHAALQRCLRARSSRDLAVAWGVLRTRVRESRALVSGAVRLEGILFRARKRALSRRLGAWRSASLAEAIAEGGRQAARGRRVAAVRVLASVSARVRRRKLEGGWRALVLLVADGRRVESEQASRSERAGVLARRCADRARARALAGAWGAWTRAVAQRRLRGAVCTATSLLEGERASLARQLQLLKLTGAVRLMVSVTERSNRALLQRGWQALRDATRRRAVLLRAVGAVSRARSGCLRAALAHWRVEAAEIRTAQVRAGAGRSLLAACLAGVRGRAMRPAWESWRGLVAREREEEDGFAIREEGLLAFASTVMRVAKRQDGKRKRRALARWRLGATRSAAAVASAAAAAAAAGESAARREAEAEAEARSEALRVAGVEQMDLRAARLDRQHAGARLTLRWLIGGQERARLTAWRRWVGLAAGARAAEERESRRGRARAQLVLALGRVADRRRRRILRRSLRLLHSHAEEELAHAVAASHQAGSREAAARQLGAVLERGLLRRQARAWARLVGSTVAASGRVGRERETLARRNRLVAAAELRSSRRLLSGAWLAWREVWAKGRHASEVGALKAERGAAVVAVVTRRRVEELQRRVFHLWRADVRRASQRKRGMVRMAACLARAEARARRDRVTRCLAKWRLACIMSGRAVAEGDRVSAVVALRGRTVAAILSRRRLRRLGEGFRRLTQNRTASVYGSREVRARRDGLSRGLRALGRVAARSERGRVATAFSRWLCFAAQVGQRSDRALLVQERRRAGAQMLGSLVCRHEVSVLSRGWALWRSGAASAAVHEGERASADLRVSGARHSAGARLLATTMGGARRRALGRAWSTWRREAKEAADAELQTMEKHFHLARTLTRLEKRNQLARVGRAWRLWQRKARSAARLPRLAGLVAGRARLASLERGMTRWRLASLQKGRAEANEGREAAEARVRSQALSALLRRLARRQLRECFARLVEHGAWAIYRSRREEALGDRLSQGLRVLASVCARRTERSKLAALALWRRSTYESRRIEDRGLLRAAGRRAGSRTLASLASHKERSSVARAWAVWRSGAASAAVHEGERASADERVLGARRSAGLRLLAGVAGSARRRAFARAWSVWRGETAAAVAAERRAGERYFHLARALARMGRRAQLTKVGRAWRAWRDVVRIEGEAEVRDLERHFHVAQTVARVMNRARERRVLRAWGLWTRLAARGRPEVRAAGSVRAASIPPGLLAAARGPHSASLARAKEERASATDVDVIYSHEAKKLEERAERSRAASRRGGAIAVGGLLRRADTRRLSRAWWMWKGETVAWATRQAKVVLGATRLEELLTAAEEGHRARVLRRGWQKWVDRAREEGARLEREADAACWVAAAAEEKNIKAAAAGRMLAATAGRWEARVLRVRLGTWVHAVEVAKGEEMINSGSPDNGSRDSGDRVGGSTWRTPRAGLVISSPNAGSAGNSAKRPVAGGGGAYTPSPPSAVSAVSSVSALRRKLRGETSPGPPLLPPAPTVGAGRQSPGEVARTPRRFLPSASPSPRSPGGIHVGSPPSPNLPRGHGATNGGRMKAPAATTAPTPGSGNSAWWGEFSDSSPPSTPLSRSPRPPGSASDSVAGVLAQAEARTYSDARIAQFDDQGSFTLSASPESVSALRQHSAGGGSASPRYRTATATATAEEAEVAAEASAATWGGGFGSPGTAGSVAYTSDASPLLGENVLRLSPGSNGVGSGGGGGSAGSGGGNGGGGGGGSDGGRGSGGGKRFSAANGPKRDWSWAAEDDVATGHAFDPVARHLTEGLVEAADTGKGSGGGGGGGVPRTPESRRSSRGRARFAKSPPYVAGSVELTSSGGSLRWGEEEEEEWGAMRVGVTDSFEEEQGNDIYWGSEESDGMTTAWGGMGEPAADEMGSAEAFVSRMTVMLWRRAFKHWVRVVRDTAYNGRMMAANRKVMLLRRQQKLRKVVVGALRRQSYAWHVSDASRAIRKWKELVRRGRDADRLSLELSRISAISPMTPMGVGVGSGTWRASEPGSYGKEAAAVSGGSGSGGRSGGIRGSSGGGSGGRSGGRGSGSRGRDGESGGDRGGSGSGVLDRYGGQSDGGGAGDALSFYRSTFPANGGSSKLSTRRRLWDQA